MKLDTFLFLESTSSLALLFAKCCGHVKGGIVGCHLVSSDEPYYLHIQVQSKDDPKLWGEWFIPHSAVLSFTKGSLAGLKRITGFSKEASE